jgi:carbamoyltransferase
VNIIEEFLDDDMNPRKPMHHGIGNWMPNAKVEDLAASIQFICEKQVRGFIIDAFQATKCPKLVYGGGVALNCVVNANLLKHTGFNEIWIMPNPGDAGSSLGAAAYATQNRLRWRGPYLGSDISGEYPVSTACDLLVSGEVIGIANGRAEFGPRALGNRSLLADPRTLEMKDKVNEIKRRQKFRPFAPAILEEHAKEWFETSPFPTPYMQYALKCKRPEEIPAVCHIDGTSRVQTVSESNHPGFYKLLQEFYNRTGCPMLLNTSLNIRGKPMVNDRIDADLFEKEYGVKVL